MTTPDRLADVLVWGVQQGWRLLGRPVNIHVTEDGLGFTHPSSYGQAVRIFINPKVLEQDNGGQLLRGLVVHELGHHAFHYSDDTCLPVTLRAHRKGLGRMLNLIMDEHLERNLRAQDPQWGECLDALSSYAFKGRPVPLVIERYASFVGFDDVATATAALLAGDAPGTIREFEAGYRLTGLDQQWVTHRELLDLFAAELESRAPERRLPEDIASRFDQLRKRTDRLLVRRTVDGLIPLLQGDQLFEFGQHGVRRARISLTSILENPPGRWNDDASYLKCLSKTLKPFYGDFPKLERFVKELEHSLGSRWFKQKRGAMLFMMRRNRDFTGAFDAAYAMTGKQLDDLFGEDEFNPGVIFQRFLERTVPVAERNDRRPLVIDLSWMEAMACPTFPALSRFVVCLRLGLGVKEAAKDPVALAALKAVPKGLRKLDMPGLGRVTEEVGRILDLLRPEEGAPVRDTSPAVDDWLREAVDGAIDELGTPAGDDTSRRRHNELRREADEASARIDEWLRSGIDPAREDDRERPSRSGPRGHETHGWRPVFEPPVRPDRGSRATDRLDEDLLNLADSLGFPTLDSTVRPAPRPAEYARLVQPLRHRIREFRTFLAESGHEDVEDPGHRRGRRLDPGSLRRLAVFNQLDVMMGVEERPAPDLFLGICIDCSSSMMAVDRMDKALAFGALLMEAAKGLPGVEGFALGFNDFEVLEVGPPGSTRLASLEPMGGNNDAGGLLALARHALLSRKERRLLVMISDGFPTDCTLDSLANLVKVLDARYGLKSLQVAVAEMEPARVAFPRFTDLTLHELPVAVRVFGKLIQKTLRREFGV